MNQEALALAFLLLVGAAACLVLVAGVRRSHYSPLQLLFKFLATLLTRFLWSVRGPRRLPLPPGQGAMIVSNHRSSIDPFFIQTVADRPTHWMVAREFCEHPAFSWFLQGICAVIPVRRGGIDTQATRMAIRLAAEGGLVGVFPEGRINMSEDLLLPARPGVIVMALRARVPIVPCYIQGSPYDRVAWSPFFMPARVRLAFGEPIDLSAHYDDYGDKAVVETLMLRCLRAIGALAGQEDFQPRLAGRDWKPSEAELEAQMDAAARRRRRKRISG
jgi:1-acyl-sn-glycerol-3-phosphate acyltransferase